MREEEGGWHASPLQLDLTTNENEDVHETRPRCQVFSAISPSSSDSPLVKLPTPDKSSEGRRQSRSIDDVKEEGNGRSRNSGGKGSTREEKRGGSNKRWWRTHLTQRMTAELLTTAAHGCTGHTRERRSRENENTD